MLAVATSPTHRRGRGALGVAFLLVAAVGVGYPLYWNHRSSVGGAALLSQGMRAIGQRPSTCSSDPTQAVVPQPGAPGVLEVPSLGLVAPVLDGLTDPVLNVAVGHEPIAPWPGNAGESVFEAHDVSYFAALDHIKNGALVQWITPCAVADFSVTGTSIRSPGDFITTPPSGTGLALITCWPTNALFWTSHRWVVTTTLVKTVISAQRVPGTTSSGPALTLPGPRSLLAQDLTLQGNESLIRLDTMTIAGTPSSIWSEGPGPMKVESEALAVYFGAYKAITEHNRIWWSSLAPGLAMPSGWPPFGSVTVKIVVAGNVPTSITFASAAATMQIKVTNDVLRVTSLS